MIRPTFQDSVQGVVIGLVVLLLWVSCLVFFLTRLLEWGSWWWVIPGILLQTFLYTGLFITAHDSMHGSVCPRNRSLNTLIGWIAVTGYALFSLNKLKRLHRMHHKHAGTALDPDHSFNQHPWIWYFKFLSGYISLAQIVGMTLVFNVLKFGLGLPEPNLLLFWVTPALLSTVQLFVFGNYLPHRSEKSEEFDRHHTRSNTYSEFLSFLTCYHFGYHWEHHEYPYVPWWKLPKVRRRVLQQSRL